MSITITLTGATLLTNGAKVGDEVLIAGAPDAFFTNADINPNDFEGEFLLTSVNSEESFSFDGFLDGVALNLAISGTVKGTISYKVVHNLTKDEQVASLVAYANGFASERVVLAWPPKATVKNDDDTYTTVDGTFIAACIASAKSANKPQQGFTNFKIAGPYQLFYSNKYFSKSQIKTLVNGGVFFMKQDAVGSNMYAVRQVTTDMTEFKTAELNCVTAKDKVSLDLISLIKPFVGPYNITDDLINSLLTKGDNYMYAAKTNKAPKCGALILNGSVKSILAHIGDNNPTIADGHIKVSAAIEVGKPFTWADIDLEIS